MASLKKYQEKRNFHKTKEPFGKIEKKNRKKLKFVVQHHLARKDHYDLRLEWDGVFISFAIPKGPSFHPKDKRLAIKVEDHPLSYGNFEGTIPKGEYGGGTVMLWDKGFWTPLSENLDFENGPILFTLKGKRLMGTWKMIRYKENWLLIKENDAYARRQSIGIFKTSIKTGRTMEEIANHKPKKNSFVVTNPDKIIFKKEKVTKNDIFSYYNKIAKRMMPFLENRLISTVRAPQGVDSSIFFMKHLNTNSINIGKKKLANKEKKNADYYYIKNKDGLLEEVQMNSYEFHIWGSKQNDSRHPDILVFDLDSDENLSIKKVREGVKDLKSILDKLHLKSFLKTSGGKGYHVFVPFYSSSWKKTEERAEKIASFMVDTWPNKYTTNIRKENRKGKIFIDYFRNKKGATSVCPYSLRLKDKATISCPIFWKELDTIKPDSITIHNMHKRLSKKDPWLHFFDSF